MSASPAGSTIFALATPAGRGAVAVVRLSGPGAGNVLERLSGARLPSPRRAVVRRLRTSGGELVDEALILWMPAPASFTGEDCAELHLHGGPAVVSAVFDLLLATGLRMAEPGEFTRRAFQNGRLDLAQAEAIADLVESESGGQRRQALAQLGGALSRRYEGWRDALLDSLALLEAEIDFPDEEVPGGVGATAAPCISHVLSEIAEAAADVRGERVREGFRVALIGAPNVGKSSLLNALVQRDAAIVTDIPGTTRDVVETPINVEGQLLVLADTAGLRDTHEQIEAEGIRRAQAWAASADLRLGVVDQTRPETWAALSAHIRPQDMLVLNKSDLASSSAFGQEFTGLRMETVATGAGVMPLKAALAAWVRGRDEASEFPAITRSRHRELLVEAADHLARALDQLPQGAELGAEDVRLALRSLERVTGRTDPEAVLDRVFSTFCIGK